MKPKDSLFLPRNSPKKIILDLIFIAAIGILAYTNSLKVPFYFDDSRNIVSNKLVKDLSFTHDLWQDYPSRFIAFFTFALNYHINGLNVSGYHLVNLAIHILTAWMVYALILTIAESPKGSAWRLKIFSWRLPLIVSLLFIAHPIQTEAVAYITQRMASLAALFYISTIVFSGQSLISRRKSLKIIFYISSLVTLMLALSTKENAFSLPISLMLFNIVFFSNSLKSKIKTLAPHFMTTASLFYIYIYALHNQSVYTKNGVLPEATFGDPISNIDYLLTQSHIIIRYLMLLLVPVRQNLDYDPAIIHSPDPGTLIAIGFIICLITSAWKLRQKSPLIGFGILFFFIGLSIESTIVPIQEVMAEHRLYLPSVGFFITLIIIVFWAIDHFLYPRQSKILQTTTTIILLIILIFLTIKRNALWNDPVAFWEDAVSQSPLKGRASRNLSFAYLARGDVEKALTEAQRSYNVRPNYPSMRHLGFMYQAAGKSEQSIRILEQALVYLPSDLLARKYLITAYLDTNNISMAQKHIDQIKEHLPNDPASFELQGNLYTKIGKINLAKDEYEKGLSVDSYDILFYTNLSSIYINEAEFSKAYSLLQKGLTIDPANAKIYNNLAVYYYKQSDYLNAYQALQKALSIDPNNKDALENIRKLKTTMPRTQNQ